MKKQPKLTYTRIAKAIRSVRNVKQLNKALKMYFDFAGTPHQNSELMRLYNIKNEKYRMEPMRKRAERKKLKP